MSYYLTETVVVIDLSLRYRESVTGLADSERGFAHLASAARSSSAVFWRQAKRWFVASALIGVLVGGAVTVVHWFVYEVLWRQAFRWAANPLGTLLLPAAGLALSGFILMRFTRDPSIHDTEEVIEAFHKHGGVFDYRSAPAKVLAAAATLGFGGAAGLEGPSVYVGGVIGSYAIRKARRFGFTRRDVRTFTIAGAAAGISAIFKAPLTGIVFALEVPYMDDMTREALVPSLIASTTSYLVLVSFLGVSPLFYAAQRYQVVARDLPWALLVGVLVGLVARAFIWSYRLASELSRKSGLPLWVRTALGGALVGILGLVGQVLYHDPLVLGTGYDKVQQLVSGGMDVPETLALLMLKTGAIVATLGSGAAGGMFIPMIVLGASAGALVEGLVPSAGLSAGLLPVAGMAAFLAAGYNTPLAAAAFIAETTGGAGYVIPGLLAAATAYAIAGRTSVSAGQRWRRESRVERILGVRVEQIITKDVIAVPEDITLREFVGEFVVKHRHKSFPVAENGQLTGFIGLADVNRYSTAERERMHVRDVAVRDVVTAKPTDTVQSVVEKMAAGDFDRIPVVDEETGRRLVGIVSTTDVLSLERLVEPTLGDDEDV